MSNNQFPVSAQCILVAVTTTASASVKLPAIGDTLRIVNEGTAIAFVSVGPGAQTAAVPSSTASAACVPILPSTERVFSITNTQLNQISAITSTGTASLVCAVAPGGV